MENLIKKVSAKEYNSTLILGFIFIIIGLKFTSGLDEILDIRSHDETEFYLGPGMNVAVNGLKMNNPVYILWYYIQSLFQPDAIKLYYLNIKNLTILLGFATFVLMRSYKKTILFSFLAGFFVLTAYSNILSFPKSLLFAVCLLAFFMSLDKRKDLSPQSLVYYCIVSLLLSYCRPAFFLSFLLFFILLSGVLIKNKSVKLKFKRSEITYLIIIGSFIIFFFIAYGLPIKQDSNRGWQAFKQMYATNLQLHSKGNTDIVAQSYPDSFVKKDMGNAQSISQALQNNPKVVLRHFLWNFKLLLNGLKEMATIRFPILLEANKFSNFSKEGYTVFIIILILISIRINQFRKSSRNYLKDKELHSNLLKFSFFVLPIFGGSLLVFSREDFVFAIFYLLLLLIGLIFIPVQKNNYDSKIKTSTALILFLLLFAITPTIRTTSYALYKETPAKPIVTAIKKIRSYNISSDKNVLTSLLYLHYYIENLHPVNFRIKNTEFGKYLKTQSISIVIADQWLLNDHHFKNDPQFIDFLISPDKFGFKQITNKSKRQFAIFIKKE